MSTDNKARLRLLEIIGVNASDAISEHYGWHYGAKHQDFLIHIPDGEVIAEVARNPSRFQAEGEETWIVVWLADFEPGKPPPRNQCYMTRQAARQAVEDRYVAPTEGETH